LKYDKLEEKLGYEFEDKKLLAQALTHRSCKSLSNNERLEFLGDAVLDLLVGEYLYKELSNANEGELSKMRAAMVSEKGFMKLAIEIDIGRYIQLSPAEENNNGRMKPSILSSAFEATIGAIYIESGIAIAKRITNRLIQSCYPKLDLATLSEDYKTALQELTQAKFGVTPEYVMLGTSGPDHQKEFSVSVRVCGKDYAVAVGKSKKEAEQNAAKDALKVLV
jgi:ribonuclease-3